MADDFVPDEESAVGRMYLRLLQLEHEEEPSELLEEVLALLVTESDAELGYVELHSADRHGHTSIYRTGAGIALDAIRSKLSTTILERVIATGESYVGNVASDAAFLDLGSVKQNETEHVLVVAVGDQRLPRGAIYLQARRGSRFSATHRARVEMLAHRLGAPLASRLLGDRQSWRDVTRALQRRHVVEVLDRFDNNKSAVARELEISRQAVHQLLAKLRISK